MKNPLFFLSFTGHGKGLFIVPAVTSVLLFCPLTAFVWSGCTCQSYKTPARQRRIHFVFLYAADLFCPSARRGLSCHDVNFLSPHTQSMHSTVPSQILSFGWPIIPAGRTFPKRFEQGTKIDPFPSPHHQTTPPFTSYLWPMAPPCPVLAGYRLVAPGPYACFPIKFVQEAACCSCVCRDLETLRLRFLAFHVGFLLVLRSNQKLGFV